MAQWKSNSATGGGEELGMLRSDWLGVRDDFRKVAGHSCIESAHHASFISFNTPGHAAWNRRLPLDVLVEHV
jgi:hypothetical protein